MTAYKVNFQNTNHSRLTLATDTLALIAVTALSILPIFLVELPAMNDYPGHLARMHVLASIGTPDQNPYYYFYLPYVYPNLAMDVIVPFFSRFMDVAVAAKAFLLLSQILLVSGAVALEMAVKRRHEIAGFTAAAVLYSLPFAWGFLNLEFGFGLALWGLAAWFKLENKELVTRLVIHGFFCVSLFVSHLVAFGLYGVTLVFYELWRAVQPNGDWKRIGKTIAILASPAALVLSYFIAFAVHNAGEGASDWYAFGKFLSILHGMNGYSADLSVANITAVVAMTFYMLKRRYFAIHSGGKWIAVGLLILIVVLPFRALGGDIPSLRIAIFALLILPAFLNFTSTGRSFRFVPAVVLSLIALVNAGHTASHWLSYQPEYAALQKSFKEIKSGSFVLVAHTNFKDDRFDASEMPLMTATALAAHYSNAFLPTLFTIPGQQPLQVCPALKRLALGRTKDYWPVAFSLLAAVANGATTSDTPAHVRDWVQDYDYLYLVGPPGPNLMPNRLTAVTTGGRFTLYRIIKLSGEDDALRTLIHRSGDEVLHQPDGCLQRSRAIAVK
jgi:hypothetical protein